MGHTRLGAIPTSRKWSAVVATVTGYGGGAEPPVLADEVEEVAERTLEAAEAGLENAINDLGLRYTFYLLTQLALSAREGDWQDRLHDLGVQVADDTTLFDVTAQVQDSIDDYLASHGRPTDISEIAQQAAGEALTSLVGPRATTLFGDSGDVVKAAVRELATRTGFSHLGQVFFGRFMTRFLNFYLSRVTAAHTGSEKLAQVGEVTHFNDALQTHCEQSARIVHDFCGEWYSKTEFQQGIDFDNSSRFLAVAVKKLRAELRRQRGDAR